MIQGDQFSGVGELGVYNFQAWLGLVQPIKSNKTLDESVVSLEVEVLQQDGCITISNCRIHISVPSVAFNDEIALKSRLIVKIYTWNYPKAQLIWNTHEIYIIKIVFNYYIVISIKRLKTTKWKKWQPCSFVEGDGSVAVEDGRVGIEDDGLVVEVDGLSVVALLEVLPRPLSHVLNQQFMHFSLSEVWLMQIVGFYVCV